MLDTIEAFRTVTNQGKEILDNARTEISIEISEKYKKLNTRSSKDLNINAFAKRIFLDIDFSLSYDAHGNTVISGKYTYKIH